MHMHLIYYRTVHYFFLVLTIIILPTYITYLLFFYEIKLIYQFLAVEKILMVYPLFIVSTFFSGKLYALRKEAAPTKWNQLFFISLLTIFILIPTFSGYWITKNYIAILEDEIPIQTQGKLNELVAYNEKFFGLLDHSRHGQIPAESSGKLNRYVINFNINQQTFKTAYFFDKTEYTQTINRLKEFENQPLSVTYLPRTKQILLIEENQVLPGQPLYKNDVFFTVKQ